MEEKSEIKVEEIPNPKEEPKTEIKEEIKKEIVEEKKEEVKEKIQNEEVKKEETKTEIEEEVAEEQKEEMQVEEVKRLMIKLPPLFGKYTFDEVVCKDSGLLRYLNLTPIYIPHTGARHGNKQFAKAKMNIVERLINGMMRTEHATGEKARTYKMVKSAFEIIETKTKRNPIQVLIDALINSAPREEVVRLQYGGISVPKAVDISPSRRLDSALGNICRGSVQSSHNNRKRIEECLADEIILASRGDMNSFAIAKKEEVERVSASAR